MRFPWKFPLARMANIDRKDFLSESEGGWSGSAYLPNQVLISHSKTGACVSGAHPLPRHHSQDRLRAGNGSGMSGGDLADLWLSRDLGSTERPIGSGRNRPTAVSFVIHEAIRYHQRHQNRPSVVLSHVIDALPLTAILGCDAESVSECVQHKGG